MDNEGDVENVRDSESDKLSLVDNEEDVDTVKDSETETLAVDDEESLWLRDNVLEGDAEAEAD